MKQFLLTLAAAATGLTCMASVHTPDQNGPQHVKSYNWESTDTISYFVAAQSFVSGTSFDIDGGDYRTYELGVVHQGNKVVFTNLFNLVDTGSYDACYDTPIEGVYNEADGTITFDANVIYTKVGNSYDASLFTVSEFNENGSYLPENELSQLVFHVTPDFKTITNTTPFGLVYSYGLPERYKAFCATVMDPESDGQVIKLNESVKIPACYVGSRSEKNVTIFNAGAKEAEYVIGLTQEGDEFSAKLASGTLKPWGKKELTFRFKPTEAGEFEAIATIETENGNLQIGLEAEALATPSYSEAVKAGDFSFETSIEYPGVIADFEHPLSDGGTETVKAIRLATGGIYGSSTLKIAFNVPEGKQGHLSYKGYLDNPTNAVYSVNLFIGIDQETGLPAPAYMLSSDFEDKYTELDFAPGDHYVYINHMDGLSKSSDVATYIWDLDLNISDPSNAEPEVTTPELFMGFGIAGKAEKIGTIGVRNHSAEEMTILSVTSDNDEFTATAPSKKAGLLETINIPVEYISAEPGERIANLTIVTNLGTVTAKAVAKVCKEPDYSTLVSEGKEYIKFGVDEDYPFVLEDGKAYNITSKHPDSWETNSSLPFEITIPEGMVGRLEYSGHAWGTPAGNYGTDPLWDFGCIEIVLAKKVLGSDAFMACWYDNDVDIYSDYWRDQREPGDELFSDLQQNLPEGTNSGMFRYYQGGNQTWYGEDRIEITDIKVIVEDPSAPGSVEGIIDINNCTFEYFDLQGRRLETPVKGINIVRISDVHGNVITKKVIR